MATANQIRQRELRQTKGQLAMSLALIRNNSNNCYLSSEYRVRLSVIADRLQLLYETFNTEVGWKETK